MKVGDYEVHEATTGAMLKIIGLASTDSPAFQRKLVVACVTKGGVALTEEDVDAIPFKFYMKSLVPIVSQVNGFGDDEGNE